MSEIHEEMEDKNVVKSAGEASRFFFFNLFKYSKHSRKKKTIFTNIVKYIIY